MNLYRVTADLVPSLIITVNHPQARGEILISFQPPRGYSVATIKYGYV